jgi:hypothetical protein
VDRFAVREKHDPEVAVLGFRDLRPSAYAAVCLNRLFQRGTDGPFDPFI